MIPLLLNAFFWIIYLTFLATSLTFISIFAKPELLITDPILTVSLPSIFIVNLVSLFLSIILCIVIMKVFCGGRGSMLFYGVLLLLPIAWGLFYISMLAMNKSTTPTTPASTPTPTEMVSPTAV